MLAKTFRISPPLQGVPNFFQAESERDAMKKAAAHFGRTVAQLYELLEDPSEFSAKEVPETYLTALETIKQSTAIAASDFVGDVIKADARWDLDEKTRAAILTAIAKTGHADNSHYACNIVCNDLSSLGIPTGDWVWTRLMAVVADAEIDRKQT